MKSYYVLQQDPYLADTLVVEEGPDDLDLGDWCCGCRVSPPPAEPVVFTLATESGKGHPDLLLSLFPLWSTRLREVLDGAGVDNVDYYRTELRLADGSLLHDDYWLANVLDLVQAVDEGKSRRSPSHGSLSGLLKQFTIDPKAARDLRLFRLFEAASMIIIDDEVKACLEAAGLVGLYIQPTEKWTGFTGGGYFTSDDDDDTP